MSFDSEVKIGIAVVAVAFVICERAWHAHRRHKSETWPISHGMVTATLVHEGHEDIVLTVRYEYPVDDEPYPVPAEFQKSFIQEDVARKWAEALHQKLIPVRFDPSNHWKSILWESDLEPIIALHPGMKTE